MALKDIPLQQLNESHLHQLIDAGAAESLYIEYKSQTYGGNDDSHKEFLADVSSFANTSGGDIVIGLKESKGVPISLSPFTGDPDSECLRFQNIARTGLEPRITNLETKTINLSKGGHILIIRVPRSYNAPHKVAYKNTNRFWARSSNAKYEPNVEQLRSLFNAAPQLADRIREFRIDRISKIAAHLGPVALINDILLIIHVIPYSAFNLQQPINISQIAKNPNQFPPLGRGYSNNWHVNFEGLLTVSHTNQSALEQPSYTQVFRSGIVEAVTTIAHHNQDNTIVIVVSQIEKFIVDSAKKYMDSLRAYGIEPPVAILASLTGTKGISIVSGVHGYYSVRAPVILNQEQFHFSETIFDSIPDNNKECAKIMRHAFEQLANTAGLPASLTFDENGEWIFS